MYKNISLPCDKAMLSELRAGDKVKLTGVIYMARDAAHKRLCEMLANGETLPIELGGAVIYYAGPCPARPGEVIGSCGPTTSARMDPYAPILLDRGVYGMIGKGERAAAVCEAIVRNGAVYFACAGGAGALLAERIKQQELIAFEELGTEALRKLYIEDFPVLVAIDSQGQSVYARK